MKKNLMIFILYTVVTTVLLGFSLVVMGISHVLFKDKANGQLVKNGVIVGSRLIAQFFSGAAYFSASVGGRQRL